MCSDRLSGPASDEFSGRIAAGRRTILRARYVFPAEGAPIADGAVAIDGATIAAVGRYPLAGGPAEEETIDLGSAAILPGLINAHTHLEFSDLAEPLGEPGLPFADWIRAVVAYRRSRTDVDRQNAILRGLDESCAAGVTALGEISTSDWPPSIHGKTEVAGLPAATLFHELLGLTAERAAASRATAEQFLESSATLPFNIGLSPHAPYTVRPKLLQFAVAQSAQRGFPLAMHLAESPEELELLRAGTGPLRDLLAEFGAWDPAAISRGSQVLDYLKILAESARTLVIHGTYLDEEEIAFLAAHAERMSVVYCPRTHARFKMAPYPLGKLLAAGVPVALGTDSRASNPDLNLFEEMRFVAMHHQMDLQRVLRMATLDGAKALGLSEQHGKLATGSAADLTIIRLPQTEADPFKLLFDPRSSVIATIRGGNLIDGSLT